MSQHVSKGFCSVGLFQIYFSSFFEIQFQNELRFVIYFFKKKQVRIKELQIETQ